MSQTAFDFHHTVTDQAEITIDKPGKWLVELVEPNSKVTLHGVFETADKDRINVEVVIHHKAPHTRASTTLKGVARDKSHIRFVGRIIIDENCGDSHSFLTERVLLLSDQAHAEAVPDLEILSDDVSCSHAASISNIPEEHIFYLMSRGVPKTQAENMIIEGFLASMS